MPQALCVCGSPLADVPGAERCIDCDRERDLEMHDPAITFRILRKLREDFYWQCFRAGVGSRAHAFIEFAGVMAKYLDLLERAHREHGIDPMVASTHTGEVLPVESHDMRYLGEKLRCIFAPFIDANPGAREVLRRELFGDG